MSHFLWHFLSKQGDKLYYGEETQRILETVYLSKKENSYTYIYEEYSKSVLIFDKLNMQMHGLGYRNALYRETAKRRSVYFWSTMGFLSMFNDDECKILEKAYQSKRRSLNRNFDIETPFERRMTFPLIPVPLSLIRQFQPTQPFTFERFCHTEQILWLQKPILIMTSDYDDPCDSVSATKELEKGNSDKDNMHGNGQQSDDVDVKHQNCESVPPSTLNVKRHQKAASSSPCVRSSEEQKPITSTIPLSNEFAPEIESMAGISSKESECCPICLDDLMLSKPSEIRKIENCSHSYHANCMKRFIENEERKLKLRCPVCRIPINQTAFTLYKSTISCKSLTHLMLCSALTSTKPTDMKMSSKEERQKKDVLDKRRDNFQECAQNDKVEDSCNNCDDGMILVRCHVEIKAGSIVNTTMLPNTKLGHNLLELLIREFKRDSVITVDESRMVHWCLNETPLLPQSLKIGWKMKYDLCLLLKQLENSTNKTSVPH